MNNEAKYIEQKIRENTRKGTLGVVTKVIEHTESDDYSNHEVNVKLINDDEEFRRVPVHTDRSGHIRVPRVNDFVEVRFLNSRTQRPYVAGFAYDEEDRAPLGRAGHWRHEFGDDSPYRYIEAEKNDHSAGAPDTVRFAKKSDGLSDAEIAIELDDSGSEPVASIRRNSDPSASNTDDIAMGIDANSNTAFLEADVGGDAIEITIDQDTGSIDILTEGQTIRVGDRNGTFSPVARQGDGVEVSDPDSGTLTGQITEGSSNVEST